MDQVLEGDLKTAQREKRDLCVALIDIDGLIYLNDAFTHAGGDQFLIACASRLQRTFHPGDWVARIGGDEFLIALHQNLEFARERLEDFRQESERNPLPPQDQRERFRKYLAAHSLKDILTVSIGVAKVQLSDTLQDCITRTEIGIHCAKNQGRDQLVLA